MNTSSTMKKLMDPQSIALIGCSETNLAGIALKNLILSGYQGKIYPVHPRYDEVMGSKCYPSLGAIEEDVDVCVIGLRNTLLPGFIDEMKDKGVKHAVIFASGFSEIGEHGAKLHQQLASKLNENGISACGPNCLGLINLHSGATLYGADCDVRNIKGSVGIVSHSGAICVAYASAIRNAGFSYLVSCGSEINVTMPDYIQYMLLDDHTDMVFCFMETIRDVHGFIEAGKLAKKVGKPIIVIKTGRSEVSRETAAAHSGALATDSVISDAFLRKHGFLISESFDEVMEFCELFVALKDKNLPITDGIAFTAISGGQLGFCCDVMQNKGLRFASISDEATKNIANALPIFATARNPLDVTTALFDTPAYQKCLLAMAEEEDVGVVMVCQDAEYRMCKEEVDLYRNIFEALAEVGSQILKPFIVFSPLSGGLHNDFSAIMAKHNLPLLQGVEESAGAVKLYLEWVANRRRVQQPVPMEPRVRFKYEKGKTLSENRSKELLSTYGIPTTREIVTRSLDEALVAANTIGYPVVLKIDSPDILHKTELQLVHIDLQDELAVREAYRTITENAALHCPTARLNGVSVQEYITGGLELILGIKNDSVLGPAIMVGMGGIFVEIFKDIAIEMAPVDQDTAMDMILRLKGASILQGARGREKLDILALSDALVRLSHLAWSERQVIQELDINPLVVLEEGRGVKALDALTILKADRTYKNTNL